MAITVELIITEIDVLFQHLTSITCYEEKISVLEKMQIKLLDEFKNLRNGLRTSVATKSDCNVIDQLWDSPKTKHELNGKLENLVKTWNSSFSSTIYETHNSSVIIHPFEDKTTDDEFICKYCKKSFVRKGAFNIHMQRHERKAEMECSICESKFKIKDDLIKHIRRHTEIVTCKICSKVIKKKSLANHIKIIHEKKVSYSCNTCDYKTYCKNSLREHMKSKHDGRYNVHPCVICNANFSVKSRLEHHLRAHTGDKPYMCSKCGSGFVSLSHLSNHEKYVHAFKEYKCDVCDKLFQNPYNLKRHYYIHAKVKPYSCPFCIRYSSNTPGNINKHVRTVHQMHDFSYIKYNKSKAVEDLLQVGS